MISSKAKHPNCMYMWMNWIISPKANAQVAEWFGEAPANLKACAETADKDHCDTFHADDEAYFDQVAYWTTPTQATAATTAGTSAWTTPSGSRPGRRSRAERTGRRPSDVVPSGTGRSAVPRCGRLLLAAPLGWLGSSTSVARRPARRGVLDAGRLHRPIVQELRPRQLPDDRQRARLPEDRAADGRRSRRR